MITIKIHVEVVVICPLARRRCCLQESLLERLVREACHGRPSPPLPHEAPHSIDPFFTGN
jgi:hypothetical protein